MSKLVAVKIIQTYTHVHMKRQSESQSWSLSITVRRFFSFWTINSALKIGNCCWRALLSVFPVFVHKKNSVDKKWSSSVAGRVF